jgi:hypothetical protein
MYAANTKVAVSQSRTSDDVHHLAKYLDALILDRELAQTGAPRW